MNRKNLLISCFFFLPMMAQAQKDSIALYSEPSFTLLTKTGSIQGTLCLPASGSTFPLALLIAGSGPTDRNGNNPYMKNNSLLMLAHEMAKAGIASLRYDKRGIAASMSAGKKEIDLRFDDMVQDASAWIDTLKTDKRFSSLTIIGHSEGSLIGMLAAKKADRFISLAGPGEPAGRILHTQLQSLPEELRLKAWAILDSLESNQLVKTVPIPLLSVFRPSVQPYLISWFRFNPSVEISKLQIPVMIIQGKNDLQVSTADAQLLAKNVKNPNLVILEKMNHVLKEVGDDRDANLKSYNEPDRPLHEKLAPAIIAFILNR